MRRGADTSLSDRERAGAFYVCLVGYAIAAGVALSLLPVLPFVAVLWLVSELGDDEEREGESPR